MRIEIPLHGGLVLAFDQGGASRDPYATARLQKGLVVLDRGEALTEEGVGLGVPVLKRGVQTVFAGRARIAGRRDGEPAELDVVYTLDLVERLARPGGARVRSAPLYAAKDSLAALHRRSPRLRGALTATSSAVRRTFRLQTVYQQVAPVAEVAVAYAVESRGRVRVAVELNELPGDVTESVVMNEVGGHHFDRYEDTDGAVLRDGEIGSWERVEAARAALVCQSRGVVLSLPQVEGAALYRGREVVGARLSWSGFGYSVTPDRRRLAYEATVVRRT